NGPFDSIELDPEVTVQLDWEAELGVIIGIGGRKILKEDANSHIFGYTVINDVTARDLQNKHMQWFKGKGLDGSCPMGPVVVTPDELPDPVHIPIKLRVNGVTKQDANTGQMMFDIPIQIADLSLSMTLEPGDIISTGTPDGVGAFAKPPEFLNKGDLMETEIAGIGTLRNRIV
ncbi:MAG TPA: fumarylacetoacetate hydrolase family protein, partial [Chloroflexia bacterium]|nr:fumarylacetoacetate hydrolase family protein [Chloroflexia bacterium]